jgi:hypothetical protein
MREAAARTLGFEIQALGVREPEDFAAAFAAMVRERPDAILMVTDALTALNRTCRRLRLPTRHATALLRAECGES